MKLTEDITANYSFKVINLDIKHSPLPFKNGVYIFLNNRLHTILFIFFTRFQFHVSPPEDLQFHSKIINFE